jgi:hypothetical protein
MRAFSASHLLLAGLIATAAAPMAAATEALELSHAGMKPSPSAAPVSPRGSHSSNWIRVSQPHTSAHRVTDVTMKRGIVGATPGPAPNWGQIAMEKITIAHEGMNGPKPGPAPSQTRQMTIIQDLKPKGPSYTALDDLPPAPKSRIPSHTPDIALQRGVSPGGNGRDDGWCQPPCASAPPLGSKELAQIKSGPAKQHEGGNNGLVHKLPSRVK